MIYILVKVYFIISKPRVPRKIFALTPTLSQRERVGVRVKSNSNPHETYFLSRLIECYILTFKEYKNHLKAIWLRNNNAGVYLKFENRINKRSGADKVQLNDDLFCRD